MGQTIRVPPQKMPIQFAPMSHTYIKLEFKVYDSQTILQIHIVTYALYGNLI